MRNADIARVLDEIADVREIQGESVFRVRAYRLAAESLRGLGQPLAEIRRTQQLGDLQHVGKAIAAKLEELLDTGACREHAELLAGNAGGLLEVVRLPGIGPKRARAMAQTLGIGSIEDLARAAADGALQQVPGLGTKTQARILRALHRRRTEGVRMLLGDALPRAEALVAQLREHDGVERVEIAGAVRRREATVDRIDLLAACKRAVDPVDRFVVRDDVEQLLIHEDSRARVRLADGAIVELQVTARQSFGSVWCASTGPDEHTSAVRRRVQDRADRSAGGAPVAFDNLATERQVYAAAGLPVVPPELRAHHGSVEAAALGSLPKLVQLDEIRGDCQMHTTASDGRAEIDVMATAAARRYDYAVITDHSKRMPGGLDARRLARQWAEIEALNSRLNGFRLLRGVEVDILEDGRLDLDDACLADAECVVAAVHSQMDQARDVMTLRLLRALDNPNVHVLAHPTGRRLNRRESSSLELERVFSAARDRGVLLECNAHPQRLDLGATNLRLAAEVGAQVVISTDAHDVVGLDHMRLGVAMARRAGLGPEQVANTRSAGDFLALIGSDG